MSTQLQHAVLQEALTAKGCECLLEVFDQLPSTSEYLNEVLSVSGIHEGALPHVVACDWQTQGSGRRGKSWSTEPGNITFSVSTVATVEPAQLMGISLVSGVSVAQALAEVCGIEVQLKWPNDIIVNERKLCGLLTEVKSEQGAGTTAIVAGVGINTLENTAVKAMGIGGTSLQEICDDLPSREMLIAAVTTTLLANYQLFYQQGWAAFSDQWASRDYLLGKSVTLHTHQQEEIVQVQGIDQQGALLVSDSNGTRAVYSGEVSVRVNQ